MFQDHIQEVLNKWQSIDDEIWAKIIVLERNRRVAKAYARAPVLTVNGSDDGFDGFRIGLAGFDNPMRDNKTEDVKRHIGQVKMNYHLSQKQHTITYTTYTPFQRGKKNNQKPNASLLPCAVLITKANAVVFRLSPRSP